MTTYTYSEARQRLASLLDQAGREGRVQIRRQDGSTFVLQPVVADRSPLDVPGVRSRLRRGELTTLVREQRERSGERIVEARVTWHCADGHLDWTPRGPQPVWPTANPNWCYYQGGRTG